MVPRNPFLDSMTTPMDTYKLGLEMMHLAAETQTVMTMRLLGMSGLWNVKPSENTRMVAEKPEAFAQSATAAMTSAMKGERPDQVMAAAVAPLRKKTKSNAARLAKRGPGIPR